ncbi:hypothetical protein [Saccharothrix sp. HUAS TT1]|uniref:hypothetical protein n=1 Tax=unclassified Saccharothrix TaxID=2593673 RepID=UPI00345BE664
MRNTEADTLDQLIEDCTDLPRELRGEAEPVPDPETAAPWQVDDANYAQVAELEVYV